MEHDKRVRGRIMKRTYKELEQELKELQILYSEEVDTNIKLTKELEWYREVYEWLDRVWEHEDLYGGEFWDELRARMKRVKEFEVE